MRGGEGGGKHRDAANGLGQILYGQRGAVTWETFSCSVMVNLLGEGKEGRKVKLSKSWHPTSKRGPTVAGKRELVSTCSCRAEMSRWGRQGH